MNKSELGKIGEDLACDYLINEGYKILARNYRRKWGEIDIVAKCKDGTLDFVEVKTMENRSGGLMPEDQMTAAKIKKFKLACEIFLLNNPDIIEEKKGWRMDLLSVSIDYGAEDQSLTYNSKNVFIKQYENVVSGQSRY